MSVQIIHVYALSCDEPGCDEWSPEVVPARHDEHKARQARKVSAVEGWTRRDRLDYCPQHSVLSPEQGQS